MKFKNIFITLETGLFNNLERIIAKHNMHFSQDDESKIMRDKAAFLIDQINYQKSIRKDAICKNGFIRIPSKFLNAPLEKELKKYREFLIRYNYIQVIPYRENKSYGYRVCYFDNPKRVRKKEYTVYKFLSKSYEKKLFKSIEKQAKIEQKKSVADRNTRHLTKWINKENIQIDWQSALNFIDNNKTLSVEQKDQYYYSLNRIKFNQWYYMRSANDNRLHSNITNLPSVLRPFLSHKAQKLVSLDIKSSQPFMLAGVFNIIIESKVDIIEFLKQGLRSKYVRDKFYIIINSITLSSTTIADFTSYKNLVCEQDIYNYIGLNLSKNFIDLIKSTSNEGDYVDMVYNPSLGKKIKTYFKDLRAYCKVLVLEYMYCSIGNNAKRLKEVKRILPNAVNKFIHDFKYCKELEVPKSQGKRKRTKRQQEKIDNSKKLFSKFLQQLEAFLILDVITKELSKIYPKMFMATIHDSIVVPKEYEPMVKTFLQKKLLEILGIKAEIKCEDW